MASRARIRARDAALHAYAQSRRVFVDTTDPTHTAGIASLLSRVYNKPVEINLVKLKRPHLDVDILASVVRQQMSDRRAQTQRIIRTAAWKAQLPNDRMVTAMKQAKLKSPRAIAETILRRSSAFGRHQTTTASVLDRLTLSQVSAVHVEAAGRLTRRISAERSSRKVARRGANAKGGAYMVRGCRKMFARTAIRAGKRRIGAFGIRARIFHT